MVPARDPTRDPTSIGSSCAVVCMGPVRSFTRQLPSLFSQKKQREDEVEKWGEHTYAAGLGMQASGELCGKDKIVKDSRVAPFFFVFFSFASPGRDA